MRGRSLAILTVGAFVLTLLFAVAAGAQENTVPETTTPTETTTPQTTTASATADATETEATTAENLTGVDRAEGSFRCELFLRVEEDGFDGRFGRRDFAGWLQYFDGDEDLLVQRIEECRERAVIADTIPDRKLPDTGGSSLALLAAGVLLVSGLAAGASIIRRRQ
jgi:LPXTG-motif cell wall-anchored protein